MIEILTRPRLDSQMNMDYGLCESIKNTGTKDLNKLLLVYDVNCQYSIHLEERIKRGEYLDIPEDLKMTHGIGLFHVHGHQPSCYSRYALTFIRGGGMASGEILESLWSTVNKISGVTAIMTPAHRVEVLDAVFGDSNWKKLINLGEKANIYTFVLPRSHIPRSSPCDLQELGD